MLLGSLKKKCFNFSKRSTLLAENSIIPSPTCRRCLWITKSGTAMTQRMRPALSPSKIELDLTNGPLSKVPELLDTQVFSGSVQWVLLEISWTQGSTAFFRHLSTTVILNWGAWPGCDRHHIIATATKLGATRTQSVQSLTCRCLDHRVGLRFESKLGSNMALN